MLRAASRGFVPVKVDGRKSSKLRQELGFDWPGDLLVVSPERIVLRRFGFAATADEVARQLAELSNPREARPETPEPDFLALCDSLLSDDPDVVRATRNRLTTVLDDVPPFDRTGVPASDAKLAPFLRAWWDLYRDALDWRSDLDRYEFRESPAIPNPDAKD